MKKTVFAAMLLLPGLSFAQNSTPKVPLNENGIGYQFPECMRAGPVCDLFPQNPPQPKNARIMAYKSGASSLTIEISNDFLTEEKQLAIIGKLLKDVRSNEQVQARMDANFPVSTELLQALNIDATLNTIKMGSYPVEIAEKHILLKFELTSK